jgi:23S rRNA pseudouridine2457 synthase
MPTGLRYFLIYKPYGMVSRFTPEDGHPGLSDLGEFPSDVYPVGRLDADSEGLLLLTNDKALNERLLHPKHEHGRTYLIQVEKEIDEQAIRKLCEGVDVRIDGRNHRTAPAEASLTEEPPLPPRDPPIRYRKNIPTSWIRLILTEGKNRQVRKMTAAVGFPTLRLVRIGIEGLSIDNPYPGKITELSGTEVYNALGIDASSLRLKQKASMRKRYGRP